MNKYPLVSKLLFLLLCLGTMIENGISQDIKITATGTGRTTGHIATLNIHNNTDKKYEDEMGPYYIPSNGKYQPYIVPTPIFVSVPPHGTLNIPLNGYCTDIHKPPVDFGTDMPPFSSWFVPDVITEHWEPLESDGWVPHVCTTPENEKDKDQASLIPVIPGTDAFLEHTIDQYKYPKSAAPVLLKAIGLIIASYDSLKYSNNINTPFSGNPEKERESVIQQAFWIFTSGLSDEEYNKNHFEAKMVQQFEENTGKSISMIPRENKDKIKQGVDDFWDAFSLVGAEAKVITTTGNSNNIENSNQQALGSDLSEVKPQTKQDNTKENVDAQAVATGTEPHIKSTNPVSASSGEPAHIQQENKNAQNIDNSEPGQSTDDEKKGRCECKKLTGRLSTNQGLKESIDIQPDMSKVNPNQKIVYPRVNFEEPKDKKKPKEFTVTISDLKLECECENGKCDMLAAEKDKFDKSDKYSIAISQITNGVNYTGKSKVKSSGSHTFDFSSTVKSDDITIKFKIVSFCKAENCNIKMCDAVIELSFKDDDEKKEKENNNEK